MANPLTGDYDAVLQVSGGTVNRLLAGMHQNAFADASRPSFPHSLSLRIGDEGPIGGYRGWVQAQIGVPRVELLHASTDRFRLEVGLRARYRADAGSRALPEFINGTVTAEFRVVDIDPNCAGWRTRAEEYVWVRVVRGSVGFSGTAKNDRSSNGPVMLDYEDPAAVNGRIARLVETLLMTRFAANPHKVGREFRRTWMRSLNPGGEGGVAIPISTDGAPQGSLSSINQLFLGGRDVAVAMSAPAIEARINGALKDRVGYVATIHFTWTVGDHDFLGLGVDLGADVLKIGWNVWLIDAWVDWSEAIFGSWAGGPANVMTLHLTGKLDATRDIFDVNFSATQTLLMHFDATNNRLVVEAFGAPKVTVDIGYNGPYAEDIKSWASSRIESELSGRVPAQHIPVAAFTSTLAEQLDKLDDGAGVRLDDAEFGVDGLVLRGYVQVTARANTIAGGLEHLDAQFVKTPEGDGFSALEAWIPGGRIDRFEWKWAAPDGAEGKANLQDRWLVRRSSSRQGRFGMSVTQRSAPLPGVEGGGTLCLRVSGVRVDSVTGALVPVSSTFQCNRYSVWYAVTVDAALGRPHLRDMPELATDVPNLRDVPELATDVPFPHLALRDARLPAGAAGSNTLVLHTGSDLDAETTATLLDGLAEVKRRDAGLAVLVLFGDGSLTTDQARRSMADLGPQIRRLGAAVLVNEDVDGRWAAALRFSPPDAPAWRLLSPRGGVTWTHDGPADAGTLAWGLDQCLLPSGPARLADIDPWSLGLSIDDLTEAFFDDLIDRRTKCPPPIGRGLEGLVRVSFVRAGSAPSVDALRSLAAEQDAGGEGASPWTTVVVDGVDQDEANALGDQLGLDAAFLADPAGDIAARLGVRIWPTTVRLRSPRRELHVVSEAAPRRRIESAEAT